jgi:hypothetical protein
MSQQLLDWAKQALEMLNDNHHLVADNEKHAYVMLHLEVIERGKSLLEQPEPVQEPVAWMNPHGGFLSATYIEKFASGLDKETHNIPLYTTPPAQPADHCEDVLHMVPAAWVGLTDEERRLLFNPLHDAPFEFARAIEAKLKEKNTALDKMAGNARELGLNYDTKGGA